MENIGQLFIVGLEGKELSSEEADFLIKNDIGGVCLFARNLESPEQIHKLCSQLHGLRPQTGSKAPLFVSVDMEGGRVHRLKAPFTQWPAAENLGKIESTTVAFQFSTMMAQELLAFGMNLDFAPCLDILTNPKNEVIGDRSISSDAETVTKISSALVRGYLKGGVIPCGKHFPGHGGTLVDSHEDLPKESTELSTLLERELAPYKKAFRARLEMVMTAHILFESVDAENPVTFSEKFLKDVLREELRYRGAVISDDLDMKALTNHYEVSEIPVRALHGGCDILLYCNEKDSPPQALEAVRKAIQDGKLNKPDLESSLKRVASLKSKIQSKAMPSLEEAMNIIGQPNHLKLAKGVSEGSVPVDLLTT